MILLAQGRSLLHPLLELACVIGRVGREAGLGIGPLAAIHGVALAGKAVGRIACHGRSGNLVPGTERIANHVHRLRMRGQPGAILRILFRDFPVGRGASGKVAKGVGMADFMRKGVAAVGVPPDGRPAGPAAGGADVVHVDERAAAVAVPALPDIGAEAVGRTVAIDAGQQAASGVGHAGPDGPLLQRAVIAAVSCGAEGRVRCHTRGRRTAGLRNHVIPVHGRVVDKPQLRDWHDGEVVAHEFACVDRVGVLRAVAEHRELDAAQRQGGGGCQGRHCRAGAPGVHGLPDVRDIVIADGQRHIRAHPAGRHQPAPCLVRVGRQVHRRESALDETGQLLGRFQCIPTQRPAILDGFDKHRLAARDSRCRREQHHRISTS
ncbi:hypothetical protein D3C86_1232550 [compost metagenome]